MSTLCKVCKAEKHPLCFRVVNEETGASSDTCQACEEESKKGGRKKAPGFQFPVGWST
jgi:protein-arginine kinase activator protein McsA